MDKFLYIVSAVKYTARMKFVWCRNVDEKIKEPEIKKAMRLTVQKMLHAEIYDKRYSKTT
jgi:hypothetical protein